MNDILTSSTLPTSFGVFKPVGYLMVGLPSQPQADALVSALHAAGWPAGAVLHFTPRETVSELQSMVDHSGALAGFGYEITLLRRYLELAQAGYRWTLAKVDDSAHATTAAEIARRCGATLAAHYRTLTVVELI